jgi:CRP/FNR family cyclic AMP-dependent transcriptional regulator
METNSTHMHVWYLRHLDLFLSLSSGQVDEITSMLDDHYIPAGAELLHDRQRERIYLVKSGAVRLYSGGGENVTLALLGPGRLFGLSSAFGDADLGIGAITLEPSYICFTTWARMLQLFVHFPDLMLRTTQALMRQNFVSETEMTLLGESSPRVRLASLLVALGSEFGDINDNGQRVKFRLTQTDMARMINASRETVNRIMTEFNHSGLVGRDRGRLVIRDHTRLEHLSRRANDLIMR